MNTPLLALGFGGPYDIAIIAAVILVLFGGAKIADLGKGVGSGLREFKKAAREDDEMPPAPITSDSK